VCGPTEVVALMSGLHGPRRGRRRRRSMMRPVTRRRKKTVLLPPSVFGQREAGSGAMRAKKKRGRQVGGRVGAHFAVWQCLAVLAGATLVGVCVWGATCTERPHLDPELRAKEDAIKFLEQKEQEQQQLQERAVSARPPTQRWAAGDSGGRAGGDGQSPVPGHSFWPADDGRQFEWAPHSRQALPSAEGAPPARPLLSENSATPEPAASEAPDAGRQLAGRKQQPASSKPADVQARTGDAPGRETSSPETSSRNNDQPEVEPRGNGEYQVIGFLYFCASIPLPAFLCPSPCSVRSPFRLFATATAHQLDRDSCPKYEYNWSYISASVPACQWAA